MYFYIYDSFLSEKRYEKQVNEIEIRLANLGITGKKIRFSILKSISDIIKESLRDKNPTVVIVGSDETFIQAAIPMANQNAVLGFIPTQSNSTMAHILGLPTNEFACDVISSRRIEDVSLGMINGQYFLSSLEFNPVQTRLICDEQYQINPTGINLTKVVNLDLLQFKKMSQDPDFKKTVSDPKDNYLEVLLGNAGKDFLFIKGKDKKDSLFFVKKLRVESKKEGDEVFIKVDQNKIVKTPAIIEVAPKVLKLIVGKDRLI
ncbi:MAG: hypothetical protein PHE59_02625 [Patescibacteria group bacterium]|nr:hypothetical protein [Patescibacteria group bacterium]MDD5164344.1 hypothetical protein [Patescibacteria group bacterium]MDD5534288.1 hypothetical protein [Patescibacteria group bacterium]